MDVQDAFWEEMRAMLGAEYGAFFEAMQDPPQSALRLNRLRAGANWGGAPAGARVAWEADGYYLDAPFKPGRELEHFAGAYYMQEPSAMASARVLDVRPGELALDLCAAPGGKSGQIAAALAGAGALVSNEIELPRARTLAGNLERLGASRAVVVSAPAEALAEIWPDRFDAVLVDAPCSGEGMFRRDPQARAEWSLARSEGCARRQAGILGHAARLVRPGGRLVYSTCTFSRRENEDRVEAFLQSRADFSAQDFFLAGVGASRGGMIRLWPHRLRGEGHFVALLRRAGEPRKAAPQPPARIDRACAQAMKLMENCVPGDWQAALCGFTPRLAGNRLFAVPDGAPDTGALRAVRPGLEIGELGRGYAKPAHALAMAAGEAARFQSLQLSGEQAGKFVRGHEVPCPAALSGWTIARYHNLPLGWGKAVNGTLKNHLPKGLRLNG